MRRYNEVFSDENGEILTWGQWYHNALAFALQAYADCIGDIKFYAKHGTTKEMLKPIENLKHWYKSIPEWKAACDEIDRTR